MSKVVIGVDPDSKANGVAVYIDKKLSIVDRLDLMEIIDLFVELQSHVMPFELHIEDVCANNAPFVNRKKFHSQKAYEAAVKATCRKVGMCQQAQIEVERAALYHGIDVFKHKISSAWKDKAGKKQFELATGWAGRSNEDSRSAAYFGFLGCG